eukprot:Amastigsp_a842122_88.p3 type:complete len:156 gc:universal Amastigsp_a842122_88:628-161(-)
MSDPSCLKATVMVTISLMWMAVSCVPPKPMIRIAWTWRGLSPSSAAASGLMYEYSEHESTSAMPSRCDVASGPPMRIRMHGTGPLPWMVNVGDVASYSESCWKRHVPFFHHPHLSPRRQGCCAGEFGYVGFAWLSRGLCCECLRCGCLLRCGVRP